jgi:hypothetical protein
MDLGKETILQEDLRVKEQEQVLVNNQDLKVDKLLFI